MKERQVDVLVIGGGVVGVCTAHFLSARGRRVTVIEKGEVCSGSSYGNAGLVVPSHSVPLAEPGVIAQGMRWMFDPESPFYIQWRWDREFLSWLWRFRRACSQQHVERATPLLRDLHLESLRLYRELAQGLDFGFGQRGRMLVCRSEEGLEKIAQEARHMQEIGLEAEVLDAEGVRRRMPEVRLDCAGGAFYAQDAHLDPARFVRGLAAQVEKQGAQIWTDTEVLGFAREGKRIKAVETTRGDFAPSEVVLAGGSWSGELGRELGMRLPIQAAKGYSVTVARPSPCPEVPFMLTEARVAITPLGDKLRFAGTLELAGMDLSVNRRRVAAILKAVPRYVPEWDPAQFELGEIWRGLRPCTPDGLPILGRAPGWDNLTVAAGHAMVGLSLGPVTGRLAAALVCREETDFDLSLLAVGRFA
jgi:D-amino-acid dehydrogenase